ncbi:DUF4199 domain-containing protein [Fulvivirga sp. M361]|uniref:DUF4199 domain-containing protein n=1 Tax=Fulvivirga sp. M361 TaxID=2594266 RepID=UPI001179BF52|nr:DUF4199 domain-containing protein [Fulvivirga sp. M361]TRX59585.1 DUF4199 domain-containing protein [Fulvivirga sp. M361]
MKTIILKNGIYASLCVVGIPLIFWSLADEKPNYDLDEIIGYSTMILCMAFVFLGIREYRDQELNGSISFGKALKTGLYIALIPSIAFGIYDLIYIMYLDPDFYDNYYNHYIQELQGELSGNDLKKAIVELNEQRDFFRNPGIQFMVMFLTVFMIGIIFSIISSFILKKVDKQAA